MRNFLAKTLFLVFIFNLSYSQEEQRLDSLYSLWQNSEKTDSVRVYAFRDYIWDKALFSEPDDAYILAEEMLVFSERKNYKPGIAAAFNLKGISKDIKGESLKSINYYLKSLEIFKELDQKAQIAGLLNNLGTAHLYLGNYNEALKYYTESKAHYLMVENTAGVAKTLGNLGIIFDDQGDYVKALDFYQKSLEYFEKDSNSQSRAHTLNNIGAIYGEQMEFSKALEYFEKSLEIRRNLNDKRGIAGSFNNIGHIYAAMSNYDEALEYQEKSLVLADEIKDNYARYNAIYKKGIIYAKLKDYQMALTELDKSLNIALTSGDKQGAVASYIYIGDVQNLLNLTKEAVKNCKLALKISQKIHTKDLQSQACKCLYKAYKKSGNGKEALVFHEKMLVLSDSLKSEETAKKLQEMEFSKQVLADSLQQVEKDLKIEFAHQSEIQKENRNKNMALAGGIFFLFLSGGLYSRWNYVKKSKAIVEKEKDRSDNLLLNILPFEIAEELKAKGSADARDFDLVSMLFTDFKGFTEASEKLTAKELIAEINTCFKAFDYICESHGIEKIKTIGDSFMAAGGLPVPSDDSVKNTVLAALEMQRFISARLAEKALNNEIAFKMRVGIHTGPVVAGIVGVKKFQYDIWGDTVNTASRMESSGEVGRVNISETTYNLLNSDTDFTFESRGKINAKGKGEIDMYFVTKS